MKEIVTLQFGTLANYIGSHFWNLEDEYFALERQALLDDPGHDAFHAELDHSILWRRGETRHGAATSTPRVVLVDRKAMLGSLSETGGLYRDEGPGPVGTWQGEVVTHHVQLPKPSAYLRALEGYGDEDEEGEEDWGGGDEGDHGGYEEGGFSNSGPRDPRHSKGAARDSQPNPEDTDPDAEEDQGPEGRAARRLDGHVRYWSDYLKVFLHPRSLFLVHPSLDGADLSGDFDTFADGRMLTAGAAGAALREGLADRVRLYAEEADNVQGFHVLAGASDGFAGLADVILGELRDDGYAKHPVLLYSVSALPTEETDEAKARRMLGETFGLAGAQEHGALYVPVRMHLTANLQGVQVDQSQWYI